MVPLKVTLARLFAVLFLAACKPTAQVDAGMTKTKPPPAEAPAPAPPPGATEPATAPAAPAHAQEAQNASPRVPLGINLSAVTYFATSIPFVDVMKMADPFLSTNAPGSPDKWDTEVAGKIPRDEDGYYPLELPVRVPGVAAPQIVRASVVAAQYPGRYTVLYDGDGELDFPASPVSVASRAPGRIEIDLQAEKDRTLFISIVRSNRADHVRNIRVIMPGYERTYAKQVFHPTFLGRMSGVGAVRFMDWGNTNNNPLQHWSERTRMSTPQAGPRGVAIEYMIDLANRLGAGAWFCVPHRADDQYVEEFAKLIKAKLDPKHRIYIEYSNELWNGIFEQAKWVEQQGCKIGLNKLGQYSGSCQEDGPRYWAGVKWNARRSGEIFKIFDKVFAGESQRLTRVLAGQAQNEHLNEVLLESFASAAINPARGKADALAVAPYIGGQLAAEVAEQGKTASISVRELLDRMEKLIGPELSETTAHNRKIAEKHGMRLVAYEGGQHLVAYGPASNDRAFIDKLIAANRDPRMRSIYMRMLDAWYAQSGNGLFMAFNYVETPNKFGVWGLLEHQEQSMSEAPKYQAFFDRLQRLATPAPAPPAPQSPPAAQPR